MTNEKMRPFCEEMNKAFPPPLEIKLIGGKQTLLIAIELARDARERIEDPNLEACLAYLEFALEQVECPLTTT